MQENQHQVRAHQRGYVEQPALHLKRQEYFYYAVAGAFRLFAFLASLLFRLAALFL